LAADAAYFLEVPQRSHAQRNRTEDERHHDHEQQAEEHLPHRIGDVVDQPVEGGMVVEEDVARDAGRGTEDQAKEDFGMQRHTAPGGVSVHGYEAPNRGRDWGANVSA